ncbi:MAG: molybdopterin-dependent oxidoreductase, partial [Thermoplasmata archaeon]|nr:molybdopterin-dependent oxidoreductase [Thermoplasmata archaeon]
MAATTREVAMAAARAIRPVVEELPVVAELDSVFPDWPSPGSSSSPHVIAHVLARHGDLTEEFKRADLVHSETYRTSGVQQVALEPHACLAWAEAGSWRVVTSTQSPFAIREDAASLLGIPESSLVVEGSWVGGAFGGKTSALLEPYAIALAAASGSPVKLQSSYQVEFELARSTLPTVIRLDTAVRNGVITARRV